MEETFKCFTCKGVFGRARSDEEAMADAVERDPFAIAGDHVVTCDDCFHVIEETRRYLSIDEMNQIKSMHEMRSKLERIKQKGK